MKLNSHASDVVGLRLPAGKTTRGRVVLDGRVSWLRVLAGCPCRGCQLAVLSAWAIQIKINDALTGAQRRARPHKNYFTCGYTMSQRLSCPTWPKRGDSPNLMLKLPSPPPPSQPTLHFAGHFISFLLNACGFHTRHKSTRTP